MAGCEGVGTVAEHEASVVSVVGGGGNLEVAEHGVDPNHFQWPRSWMWLGSTPAQSRAVAPPGRRLRAESFAGGMPVLCSRAAAAWRRPWVIQVAGTEDKVPAVS